ncbi:uncharacterized protein FIBRA_04612 [Fibroporia radiculosa]|uniref:Uncharacterized protein n=1 Tax=Fibroporia radiculosa TaxID=599839 RepID=J4GPI9_9APHY|nr:uncharacterized protein FIBRA_04612 [Fibroporia radiculosa]CCM02510.1 predicted protein [Fibroporia radiculosa]
MYSLRTLALAIAVVAASQLALAAAVLEARTLTLGHGPVCISGAPTPTSGPFTCL